MHWMGRQSLFHQLSTSNLEEEQGSALWKYFTSHGQLTRQPLKHYSH